MTFTADTSADSLDDIFGSSPPEPSTSTSTEPSDLPSLRRQHVTAGYRDGISLSKAEHIQRGFDAGYPVGAQLGMRAGTVLGILEGILRGLDESAAKKLPGRATTTSTTTTNQLSEEEKKARRETREGILRVYRAAVRELDVQAVFADNNNTNNNDDNNDNEKPESRLRGIGDSVVSMWEGTLDVARWEENIMDALEMKEEEVDKEKLAVAGQS